MRARPHIDTPSTPVYSSLTSEGGFPQKGVDDESSPRSMLDAPLGDDDSTESSSLSSMPTSATMEQRRSNERHPSSSGFHAPASPAPSSPEYFAAAYASTGSPAHVAGAWTGYEGEEESVVLLFAFSRESKREQGREKKKSDDAEIDG